MKPRSPFTTQHLNDQQPSTSYNRPPTDSNYVSKYQPSTNYAAKPTPMQGGTQTFTPQGSGRRSGSLMENEGSNGRGSEDIRAKLARYKKEREDFEVVRQQFRSKNLELPAGGQGTKNSYSENTPIDMKASGSGIGTYKFGTATENAATSGGNIFAMDGSANQV